MKEKTENQKSIKSEKIIEYKFKPFENFFKEKEEFKEIVFQARKKKNKK